MATKKQKSKFQPTNQRTKESNAPPRSALSSRNNLSDMCSSVFSTSYIKKKKKWNTNNILFNTLFQKYHYNMYSQ